MRPMKKLLISILLILAIIFNVTSCDLLASKGIDVEGFISSILNRDDIDDEGAEENNGTDGEDGEVHVWRQQIWFVPYLAHLTYLHIVGIVYLAYPDYQPHKD